MFQEKLFLSRLLPESCKKVLFGDRSRYGLEINRDDPDWCHWQQVMSDAYAETQQQGIGDKVCRLAYGVVEKIDFQDQEVLEIGPGTIRHLEQMTGRPKNYTICDVSREFLQEAEAQLRAAAIPCTQVLVDRERPWQLPFDEAHFDTVITFFSLEHLFPLDNFLREISRVIKPHGRIVGGIPCEGGLAWGLGRFLTSRPALIQRYRVNYDKIICWEHPNFADFILSRLSCYFNKEYLRLYPFPGLPLDINLVASFIFAKKWSLAVPTRKS